MSPLCPGREGLGGEDRETVAMVGWTELMYKELSILKTVDQDRETVAGAGGDHTSGGKEGTGAPSKTSHRRASGRATKAFF